MREPVEYARFDREHLEGVVACAMAFEWPSYSDPSVTLAAFTALGAVSWVALVGHRVVGVAHLLTNGVVHSHLSLVGVLPEYRRRGIARRLIAEAFQQSGGKWLDLCAEPDSEGFYRSFRHERFPGFRLYPSASR